ncbi:hypothetical protein MMC17_009722 [Xylographa soralifera]|nr:hypothetical protein [Xylographa soralifera]
MFITLDQRYVRLGDQTFSSDEDIESEKSTSSSNPLLKGLGSSSHGRKTFLVFQITLFCLSSLLFVVSLVSFRKARGNTQDGVTIRKPIYSPIFDQLSLPESTIKFNAVDSAWEHISRTGALPITSADVLAIGKNPLVTAKYPLSSGLGSDAHIASIDVFHQIHCLNEMRKWIHPHYYFGGLDISDPPLAAQKHISPINIMCHADVEVYTWRWVDVQKHPLPDFSINKQCRDFNAVLNYQDQHDWDFDAARRPLDVEPAKAPQDFLDLFEKWDYKGNSPVLVEEQ